ncbi:MAG: AbrB/MazE/SpoVT family DNA-binding domain-containing protein [Alphaproteobacteria bacterium]|nr:AbrB/MazE/SpoVT family DNA-binding domain-containing protein [Alphaproteobacteria bacterium]
MTSRVQISRWGNSLAIRVPRDIAARTGLTEGIRVDIDATADGTIVISRSLRRFSLDELLKEMTPERQHRLEDDPPRGAELL